MKVELSGVSTVEVDIEWKKTINISKKDVVEALELDGDDKADWRDHIEEYVEWLKDEEDWATDIENNIQSVLDVALIECSSDIVEIDGWTVNSARIDYVNIGY